MNKHSMIFIGLDTHKEFHEVAYCEEQRGATPVHYGRIPSSKVSVKKLLLQFESKYPSATLHVVYEAGPCGYWIYRLPVLGIVAMSWLRLLFPKSQESELKPTAEMRLNSLGHLILKISRPYMFPNLRTKPFATNPVLVKRQ